VSTSGAKSPKRTVADLHRPPAPGATCVNEILNDQDEWALCGLPWDGLSPDADPCCPRCRAIVSLAARAFTDWLIAELDAYQQRQSRA
jgi:hypothetical protein